LTESAKIYFVHQVNMTEQTPATGTIERICPNCQHFYEHGKTEWEDAKECEDCTRRGGIFDNWKDKNPPAPAPPAPQ
jgi:hypothetical protein